MAGAVWMIIYDLDRNFADQYLPWFDAVHIPEKLARPGYTWAAHYRVEGTGDAANARYIALFGGTDSRVFYDPSPAQIKPGQPPETRRMMGYRSNSQMLILAEEWAVDGAAGAAAVSSQIDAERISLALCSAQGNDENLGAWLVQDYPAGLGAGGVTRKFLASTGAPRHVVVRELGADAIASDRIVGTGSSEWSEQVAGYLSGPALQQMVARRVWPVG